MHIVSQGDYTSQGVIHETSKHIKCIDIDIFNAQEVIEFNFHSLQSYFYVASFNDINS